MNFIFRIADRALLSQSYTLEQHANEGVAVLANEGGVVADYVYLENEPDIPAGYVAILDNTDAVEYIANPVLAQRAQEKQAARTALQALGLAPGIITTIIGE